MPDDESTEDEDSLQPIHRRPGSNNRDPSPEAKTEKKEQSTQDESTEQLSISTLRPKFGSMGGEKVDESVGTDENANVKGHNASDRDSSSSRNSSLHRSSSNAAPLSRPTRKDFGTIGAGMFKAESPGSSCVTRTADSHLTKTSPESIAKSQKRPGRLGIIGCRKTKAFDGNAEQSTELKLPASIDEEDRSKSLYPTASRAKWSSKRDRSADAVHEATSDALDRVSPRLEESAQERADRKREDLKRQLDAKSKAQSNKKRRF